MLWGIKKPPKGLTKIHNEHKEKRWPGFPPTVGGLCKGKILKTGFPAPAYFGVCPYKDTTFFQFAKSFSDFPNIFFDFLVFSQKGLSLDMLIPIWAILVHFLVVPVFYLIVKKIRNNGEWTILDFFIAAGIGLLWEIFLLVLLCAVIFGLDYNKKSKI